MGLDCFAVNAHIRSFCIAITIRMCIRFYKFIGNILPRQICVGRKFANPVGSLGPTFSNKHKGEHALSFVVFGGDSRTRTYDLLHVKQAL